MKPGFEPSSPGLRFGVIKNWSILGSAQIQGQSRRQDFSLHQTLKDSVFEGVSV